MKANKLINRYFADRKEILQLFECNYNIAAIDDSRHFEWMRQGDKIYLFDGAITPERIEDGDFYKARIVKSWSAGGYLLMNLDRDTGHVLALEILAAAKEVQPTKEQLDALEEW